METLKISLFINTTNKYFVQLPYCWIHYNQVQTCLWIMFSRVPSFCYEGLQLVAFWWFYCINLVYELIPPLIDNTVQQATQLFIILLKTKKLKIVEDNIFNVFVLFTISNQPEFSTLNSQPLLDRETTKTKKNSKLKTFCLRVFTSWRWSET